MMNPDYFSTSEECKHKKYINTNPRYKHFKQNHFTAGDEEQFHSNRIYPSEKIDISIDMKDNKFYLKPIKDLDWEGYKNNDANTVTNTFRYIFNKFKKGIYVHIINNELKVFLPFSKVNYQNEWSEYIKVDPKRWKDISEFIIYCASQQGIKIEASRVNRFINTWYANNFLVRPEYPTGEHDSGVPAIRDMLLELCKTRKVPDLEFFINRRDSPILKKDKTEAYSSIFGKEDLPLLSHFYSSYSPIFGMVGHNHFADIPIPTFEDWARVSCQEGKYFEDGREFNFKFDVPFDDRKEVAVFRGSSTGEGTTIENNPRLKLAKLCIDYPDLIDAGITKWNTRARKEKKEKYLTTIEHQNFCFGLKNFLSTEEQGKYKYIINVDGHTSAYRLSLELGMGSVILLQDSDYHLWFRSYLKPFKEYVPLKKDLSDFIEKIRWCKENNNECKKIAENALKFYNKYLTKKGILDYLQKIIIQVKKKVGNIKYNSNLICDVSFNNQKKEIQDEIKVNFEEMSVLYKNPNTTIFKEGNVLIKCSKNEREIVNGGFIGYKCINSVTNLIPNFIKTYSFSNNTIKMEEIQGIIFRDWIEKNPLKLEDFGFILAQLSLALQLAQEKCLFHHRDLFPWNIIIKKVKEPIKISYELKEGIFEVYTDLFPVLIDYGRSKAEYNDIYFGYDGIFNYYPFQDCFTILTSSINDILKNLPKGSRNEITKIIELSRIFYPSKNLGDLRSFVNQHKKYNEIVYNNKEFYISKYPIDLFHHLSKIFQLKKIKNVDRKENITNQLGFYLDDEIMFNPKKIKEKEKEIKNIKPGNKLDICNISSFKFYIKFL